MQDQSTSTRDSAFNSLTMRVLVPFNDVPTIIKLSKDENATFTVLDIEPLNGNLSVAVLFLDNSFSLYSLAKLVAYHEFLNPTKANQHDQL